MITFILVLKEKGIMKFPSAYKGVKKLFIAEILSVIAALLVLTTSVMSLVGLKVEGALVAAGTTGLVASIALIVAFILSLIGLHQAGKDELQIQYSFCLTILAIILSLVAIILGAFKDSSVCVTISGYVNIVVDVITVFALEFVLRGIATLADKLGDKNMAQKGRLLATLVLFLFAISIILGLFSSIITHNAGDWVSTTIAVAALIAGIAELIVYILIFVYYGFATKMLKK